MNLGDFNFLCLMFFLLLYTLLSNPTTTLQYLLTAELLWVTLYACAAIAAITNDEPNLLALTLLFLVLSAVEISIGLILVSFQSILTNSNTVIDARSTHIQFLTRMLGRISLQ